MLVFFFHWITKTKHKTITLHFCKHFFRKQLIWSALALYFSLPPQTVWRVRCRAYECHVIYEQVRKMYFVNAIRKKNGNKKINNKKDDVTKNERSLFHVNGFQNGARNSSDANKQTFRFFLFFFLIPCFSCRLTNGRPTAILFFSSPVFVCFSWKNN